QSAFVLPEYSFALSDSRERVLRARHALGRPPGPRPCEDSVRRMHLLRQRTLLLSATTRRARPRRAAHADSAGAHVSVDARRRGRPLRPLLVPRRVLRAALVAESAARNRRRSKAVVLRGTWLA